MGSYAKIKLLLVCCAITVCIYVTDSKAQTGCSKIDIISNKDGDLKLGEIINPPKGSNYSVWFPVVPTALAFDSKGNIYVGDSVKYRIVKFDKDGKFVRKYSLQKPMRTKKPELSHIIQDMTVDGNDNLYVINQYEYRIELYDQEGKFLRFIDYYKDATDKKRPNMKYHPYKITVDNKFKVYLYGPKLYLVYSPIGILKYKNDRENSEAKDENMAGFSGYYYDIKSYAPDPKLPGKMRDIIIIKDKHKQIVNKCDNIDIEVAYDDGGKIYKADNKGNFYTFDYYNTLNVIKVITNLK